MNKLIYTLLLTFTFIVAKSQDTLRVKQDSSKNLNEVVIECIRADVNAPITQTNLTKKALTKNYFGQDVPVILNRTPSINLYADGGAYNGYMYMRMRGMDQTRINMTLNGVPLNEPEDQGAYFSNYSDFGNNINSIQIQRGVGGSSNGVASYAGS